MPLLYRRGSVGVVNRFKVDLHYVRPIGLDKIWYSLALIGRFNILLICCLLYKLSFELLYS